MGAAGTWGRVWADSRSTSPPIQRRDGSVGHVLVGAEAAEGDLLPKLVGLDHVLEGLLCPLAC